MAHEDADVVKIRSFVTKCLESVGAIVDFSEYDYAQVLIPDELARHFDGETYFNLAFDFDVARQHEDGEFVTYGSYFLDRVIDLASRRGLACRRHILDENVENRTLPQKIKGRIAFRNCRSTFMANAPAIYHYVLFNFRVSYISDERKDRLAKVLVNLNTGHVDDRMLGAIESVIFADSSHTNYPVEQKRSVDYAYQAAMRALEERIQPAIHDISAKIRTRLVGEKNRVMEYYDEIDSELNLKRGKLVERNHPVKSIDEKLHLSEIERQRRLIEIEEKNALKVSIMLFNAILISHTKIRNRYRVKRGRTERDMHVVWNPVLNEIDPLICEICGEPTLEVELCSNSHLGCTNCVHACSVCGARLCKDCGMTACSVCGDPLCGQCNVVCPDCGDTVCEKHVESCTCKQEKRQKAAERAEKRKQKKLDEAERKRQERFAEFEELTLPFPRAIKRYMSEYMKKNIDALDEKWKGDLFKAQVAIAQGNNTRARTILQRLDQEYPDNAWVKSKLVLSYKGWTQKVALLANQAVDMAPNMAIAHVALGHVQQIHGTFWSRYAVNIYEKAIELAKDDEADLMANTYYQIGRIMQDYDYLGDAYHAWRKAISIDPGFEPAREALRGLKLA